MKNALNWFDLPTEDFERAVAFYSQVLDAPLRTEIFLGEPTAIFPHSDPGMGGSLVKRPGFTPAAAGPIVYLNAGGDLDGAEARIVPAGGQVLQPKTALGPAGFVVILRDTEGNRVALHAPAN